jgi:hypothetical protein
MSACLIAISLKLSLIDPAEVILSEVDGASYILDDELESCELVHKDCAVVAVKTSQNECSVTKQCERTSWL